MANKIEEDAESNGIRHILGTLMQISESKDIEDMVECFDTLVIQSEKYEHIENTVQHDNQQWSKMSRLIKKVVHNHTVEDAEDDNG